MKTVSTVLKGSDGGDPEIKILTTWPKKRRKPKFQLFTSKALKSVGAAHIFVISGGKILHTSFGALSLENFSLKVEKSMQFSAKFD
jgi:hypothetical protein